MSSFRKEKWDLITDPTDIKKKDNKRIFEQYYTNKVVHLISEASWKAPVTKKNPKIKKRK